MVHGLCCSAACGLFLDLNTEHLRSALGASSCGAAGWRSRPELRALDGRAGAQRAREGLSIHPGHLLMVGSGQKSRRERTLHEEAGRNWQRGLHPKGRALLSHSLISTGLYRSV